MLIVGENLRGIVRTCAICDTSLIEEFSLRITIDPQIRRLRKEPDGVVTYGTRYDPVSVFEELEQMSHTIRLAPGDRLLACSEHDYAMPLNYFGLVQTKGSMARLFISATCNDGQIEPGYSGRITLEMANLGSCTVLIPVGSNVAQLFIFRCSTTAQPYHGRYQGSTGPTIADFTRRL